MKRLFKKRLENKKWQIENNEAKFNYKRPKNLFIAKFNCKALHPCTHKQYYFTEIVG